ncbi:hypothetical protein M407DRAFT_32330 [Tulasnella calospora MUT 4182]|uniref:Uncharacterized protein n=1 Tax=Tulasnella calospora MUT 4182 TaxID=1051891 RepID=A0A0C3K9D8_9AGAM|nr:hypothetical protein M407DRAFT_32330 [Tulasnella calospora MUT 4182]
MPLQPPLPDLWETADLIHSHGHQHNKVQYGYMPEVPARKRKAAEAQQSTQAATSSHPSAPPPVIRSRKARHCIKCQKDTSPSTKKKKANK